MKLKQPVLLVKIIYYMITMRQTVPLAKLWIFMIIMIMIIIIVNSNASKNTDEFRPVFKRYLWLLDAKYLRFS